MKESRHTITYINVEISDLKKIYYNNGHDKTAEIIINFARILKASILPGDICGTMYPGCFGVVSFDRDDAAEIFESLKKSTLRYGADERENAVSFKVGECTVNLGDKIDIWDMIYAASVNSSYSYSRREHYSNPQFEKLCSLRSRMMKNPELNWSIREIAESMFISKSYLQKIYKTYFGKSIIEELIEFRINKAKELIINTDMTIGEIAAECGYSTYNYFARQFREYENISPSEYRERQIIAPPIKS